MNVYMISKHYCTETINLYTLKPHSRQDQSFYLGKTEYWIYPG